jgi:hypothetical protein
MQTIEKYWNLALRRRRVLGDNGTKREKVSTKLRNVGVDVWFKLLTAVDRLHGVISQKIEPFVSVDVSRILEYILC